MEMRQDQDLDEDQEQDATEGGASGESSSADSLPAAPSGDDDSALGDTDQHSDA